MKLLKIIKKKKKGFVDKMVPLLLVILSVFIVMEILICWGTQMKMNQKAEDLMREYIIKMEANGYLTQADKSSLEQSLNDIGITVSNWGNTTLEQVGYGEKIILEINGQAENKILLMNSFGSLTKESDTRTIHKIRTSTAKW